MTYRLNSFFLYSKPVGELARALLSFKRPPAPHRTSGNIPPHAELLAILASMMIPYVERYLV